MNRSSLRLFQLAGSTAVAAVGVAIAEGPLISGRSLVALVLIGIGVGGVATLAADRSVAHLGTAARRWWLAAVAGFLPYALATAPDTDSAAAVGAALSGPLTATLLEAIAGALVLNAVTLSVLCVFARQGIHPGAPTPEERVLDESLDD